LPFFPTPSATGEIIFTLTHDSEGFVYDYVSSSEFGTEPEYEDR